MTPFVLKKRFIPRGKIKVPGDKSIAHRALLISAVASGTTTIKNFPIHDDSWATRNALVALGVKISPISNQIKVSGRGLRGLSKPRKPIFVNNSGTTLRLLSGLLAGQNFKTKLVAAKYLAIRPMARVNIPLRMMGAEIIARKKGLQEYPPITINGKINLKGITYTLPVASAQVKSAILLAGLSAKGKTKVIEKVATRDHTERMLKTYGADITIKKNKVILNPGKDLTSPGVIYIPGDISSAAFFMVLAAILPKAKITITGVSLNPSRSGIINVLKRMQANIKILPVKSKTKNAEPWGNIIVNSSSLKGTVVNPQKVPSLIDELPVLMVAACFARGKTIIRGVGELRVKETDRINSNLTNLLLMGADIRLVKTGNQEDIIINGLGALCGAQLKSFGDHRTAMSMVVAAMAAEGQSRIDDVSCINKSFPGFLATLNSLMS
jgi:3-phosphoshikimate 1-carboxyvinyltransferase